MDISLKITNLYKQKLMTLQDLAEKIGMTKTGLHNALKSNDFKVSMLKKIADVLEVEIISFFETNEAKILATELKNKQFEKIIHYEYLYGNYKEYREKLKYLISLNLDEVKTLQNGEKLDSSIIWKNILKILDLELNEYLNDRLPRTLEWAETNLRMIKLVEAEEELKKKKEKEDEFNKQINKEVNNK